MYGMTIFTRRAPQAWLVAAISALVVSRGLTSRIMFWHDELINTFKASVPIIADYAVRPVFYGINYAAFHFFGERYESLVFVAALAVVVSALLVHRIAWMLVASPLALLAPLLYLSHFWTLPLGVHAMPHVFAACFGVLSLWCLLRLLRDEPPAWLAAVGVGLGMALALLSHHTGIVYVALDAALLGVFLVATLWKKERAWKSRAVRILAVFAIAGLVILGTEVGYRLTGQSYVGSWKAAVFKVGVDPAYDRYGQPFTYYFVRLHQDYAWTVWFLILAAVGGLGYAVLRRRASLGAAPDRQEMGAHVLLVLYGLASLFVISFVRWKFPRVVVGFGPVASLALFSMAGMAVVWVRAASGARASRLFSAGLAMALAVLCLLRGYEELREVDTQSQRGFWKYSSLYGIAQSLQPGGLYGFIGDERSLEETNRFFVPGGNKVVSLGTAAQILGGDRERFVECLMERGIDHVVVASQTVGESMPGFRRTLHDRRFTSVFDWRGILEVWTFQPFRDLSFEVVDCLLRMKPGSRVGIVRGLAEPYQRRLAKACGLRPVRLRPTADGTRFVDAVRRCGLEVFVLPVPLPGETKHRVDSLRSCLHAGSGGEAFLEAASRASAFSRRQVEVWRIREAVD